MPDKIVIKGARTHNLKNINLEIPKNKLVVFTGLSGSGKSSLAFDTIYAEGQRRYTESLASYARQFMEIRNKPDVDSIDGLSPTIAIEQKRSNQNPRSTVGTVTEIYDYLRLLFARFGEQHCPKCGVITKSYQAGEIVEIIKKLTRKNKEVLVLASLSRQSVVDKQTILTEVEKSGYDFARVDGQLMRINELAKYNFKKEQKYTVELLIGTINDARRQDVSKIVDKALDLSNGLLKVVSEKQEYFFSTNSLCDKCGLSIPVVDIRNFSFNSPYGACQRCTGLGVTKEIDPELVIPNRRLTLAEGAVQPWTRLGGRSNQEVLQVLAERYKFSLDVSVSELSKEILDLILNGLENEICDIGGKKINFLGVIPTLTKKYLEANSEYIHKEIEQYMQETVCPVCRGKRLKADSLAVKIAGYDIAEVAALDILAAKKFYNNFFNLLNLPPEHKRISNPIVKEIIARLENLQKVGLEYISLNRPMNTLSGGEATRVRLASQLSTGLNSVIYVLDEPSVGLHPRDNKQLIDSLKSLRDSGNSVLVVEHDEAMIKAADYLVDIGPGAGAEGGQVVACGTVAAIEKNKNSLTGGYLSGRLKIECEKEKIIVDQENDKQGGNKKLSIIGVEANNLKNININIPLGKLVCVTGVSGSGKSTLIIDVLSKALSKHFFHAKDNPGQHKEIKGLENIDKVITIDQSPIGRTPRSNPATYINVFVLIRDLFANLPESKMYNYNAGKFSFNVKGGGRCEACAGEGYVRIPMQFLADVYMECDNCYGTRYSKEALEVHFQGKNIADVLSMTVEEARLFFGSVPAIADKLSVLSAVGLGYIRLGQPATTLSGGEAQRIKLAAELSRASTGRTLYILDEPTTGLHFEDIKNLLKVLNRLVAKGNTIIVIEHNLQIIQRSDWVIDLGPEGGERGGKIVAQGTPEEIARVKNSWTGRYLKGLKF